MLLRFLSIVLLVFITSCSDTPSSSKTPKAQLPQGKLSVINFWAVWCKPCIKEIPELNTLANKRSDIEVFGINFDGIKGDELQQEVTTFDIQYTIADLNFAEQLKITKPSVLPTTLIVSDKGIVLKELVGPQTAEQLDEIIDSLSN